MACLPVVDISMELDIENFDALREYLTEQKRIQPGEAVSFENLHGGVSNRAVKVAWTDGRGWVAETGAA